MNESAPAQATLETQPKKESKTLRGMSFASRLIGATALSVATLVTPTPAEAGRRGDIAGAVLGGAIIGATLANAQHRQEAQGNNRFEQRGVERVAVNPELKEKLISLGFRFGPEDQYIDNMQGQKLIFKNPGRDDKWVNVSAIAPYQLLLRYGYIEDGKKYEQSVFCNINQQTKAFTISGKTKPVEVRETQVVEAPKW